MPSKPEKIIRPWSKERPAFARENNDYKFYNSSRWRKVARLHKVKNPLCVKCEALGLVVPVAVTDHIKRVKDGGAPYDPRNLQSLCHKCHNSKSGQEAHGYKESNY